MKVLGLFDWHNAGAALVDEMRVLAAVEEERLSRTKVEFGLPRRSMDAVLDIAGVELEQIDAIAVCGIFDPTPVVRWRPERFAFERQINARWRLQYRLWKLYYELRRLGLVRRFERALNRRILRRQLASWPRFRQLQAPPPILHVDHHLCHAAAGYRASGFDESLVVIVDGSGDGASTVVYAGRGGRLERLAAAPEKASFAKMYANATLGLGFKKLTGEGKLMGLAAAGDAAPFAEEAERVLEIVDLDRLHIRHHADLLGNGWALDVRRFAERLRREDIAAAVQRRFEELVCAVVSHFVGKTGLTHVVLAGGGAMNVKANQRVRELPNVDAVFVPPAMTDAGVALGAALETCHQLMGRSGEAKASGAVHRPIEDCFLGPEFSERQMKAAIDRRGLHARRIDDIDVHCGELVAGGSIVARFTGRMEHGPRALGHRSILALVTLGDVEQRLNQRLGRDEFMPFAPSILEEHAATYLERYVYSPFMAQTFDVKPEFRQTFPAVVHVDGTLRPQIVRRSVAPGYWRLIHTVGERTGHYLVLNTSFNLHGDPIICSPDEALDAFERGAVDFLALGSWLLEYGA